MNLRANTAHPDEVRNQFHEYADILEMYASDQLAMVRRNLGKRESSTRAKIYSEIAAEIRSIVFEAEKAG